MIAGATPKRAAERVLAERRARQRAASEGVEIVDPRARFGPDYQRYAVTSPDAADGQVVASIDPLQGGLVYYPAATAPAREAMPTARPAAATGSSKLRASAIKGRRAACPRLVAAPPPREKLLPLLAGQYACGATALATSPAGWSLAYEFSSAAGLASANHSDASSFRKAASRLTDLKAHLEIAWACVVAGYELRAADKGRESWDHVDATYMQLLQDRANYSPTPWERDRIEHARVTNQANS